MATAVGALGLYLRRARKAIEKTFYEPGE
jgi:hypothetical protein